MKISNFLFVFITLFLLNACGGNTNTAEESKFSEEQMQAQQTLWDEMMVVHDDVMPKMGAMNKITKSLKSYSEKGNLEGEAKEAVPHAIQKLELADKAMWDWMHGLKKMDELRDSLGHDEILTYLKEQKNSIDEVKNLMLASMRTGEAVDDMMKASGQ